MNLFRSNNFWYYLSNTAVTMKSVWGGGGGGGGAGKRGKCSSKSGRKEVVCKAFWMDGGE